MIDSATSMAVDYLEVAKLFDLERVNRIQRDEHGKGVPFEKVMAHLRSFNIPDFTSPEAGAP